MMNVKKFLLCLTVILMAACQSQTPSETPCNCPEAPSVESPKAAAPVVPDAPVVEAAAADAPVALTPGEPSEFAGKVVPAGVDYFGALNLRALKDTTLERQFRPWFRYLDGKPDYKILMEETGAGDLLGHTLIIGGTFAPHTSLGFDLIAAVFGLEDDAKMAAWVAARIADGGPPPAREFKTGQKDGVAAWIAGPSLTADVEALLEGGGKSVNQDDAWVELQRAINTKAPIWALVRIPELVKAQFPLLHQMVPGLQFFPGVSEVLGMTHAAFSLDIGDRLELRFAVRLKSADDAKVVLEQLEMAAEAILWDPALFFDVFQLQASGSLVTLAAASSKKAWRITVFWLSIAAQAAAFEEMQFNRWEENAKQEEAMEVEVKKAMEEAEKMAAEEATKMAAEETEKTPTAAPAN